MITGWGSQQTAKMQLFRNSSSPLADECRTTSVAVASLIDDLLDLKQVRLYLRVLWGC